MAGNRGRYPPEYKEQIVELVRSGRSPGSLAREFEPSEQTIWNWVKQADMDEGRRSDGLTPETRLELLRLQREVSPREGGSVRTPRRQPAPPSLNPPLAPRTPIPAPSPRNPLLNFRPTKRRGIEVVDERSRQLFQILVGGPVPDGSSSRSPRVMYFLPASAATARSANRPRTTSTTSPPSSSPWWASPTLPPHAPRRASPHQGEDDLVRDRRGGAEGPGCVS